MVTIFIVSFTVVVRSDRRKRSEVETLGLGLEEEDEGVEGGGGGVGGGGARSSRQRAAKRVAKNAYTIDLDELEYLDSPASSAHSKDTESTSGGRGGGSGASKKGPKQKVGRKKKRGRGKGKAPPTKDDPKAEPRVPPMKIKMIGRSGESDSPIFFAESMESWDEDSENEGGMPRLKRPRLSHLKEPGGLDSETSSLALGERDEGVEEIGEGEVKA